MSTTPQAVCEDIFQLIDYVKLQLLNLAEAQGLTQVQLFALYVIDRRGDLAMGQVADVLHCDASNVTGIVDRMVAQDLVVRQPLEKDRRTKMLQLTAKGKKTVAMIQAALPAQLNCDKLTKDECACLNAIIEKICT